jgi:hypothetical protein
MSIKERSLKNDLAFGLSKEEPVRQKLKKVFVEEEDILNTKDLYNDEYCKFDYEGTTLKRRYEVKSRTNTKYKYSTTIIPVHKITPETTKNGLYLIFNFTDICSYIIYDKTLFETFNTKMMRIWRDGKYDPPCLHYEIPVNILIDMN